MSKISDAFKNGKAFIPFITCGDPDLETTGKIVREMASNGADLIELGAACRCDCSAAVHDLCKCRVLIRH